MFGTTIGNKIIVLLSVIILVRVGIVATLGILCQKKKKNCTRDEINAEKSELKKKNVDDDRAMGTGNVARAMRWARTIYVARACEAGVSSVFPSLFEFFSID